MTTKTCKKCSIEKRLKEFYRHSMMADGHLNECKACTKARVLARRNENIDAVRAYDRLRGKEKHRIQNATEQTRAWRAQDKRRMAAHNAVARALRSGKLQKKPCERCESDSSYAHHDNYDKKLDVKWLCQPCHKERHKELALAGIEP